MNQEVIEKLKKILRLADNAAATEGEVKAAMSRAKEIAMQNNIDLAQIDFTDPNAKAKTVEVEKGTVPFSSTRERAYHRFIAQVIKEVFGVFIVKLHAGYAFIGDKHDVAVSQEIFPFLETAFERSFRAKVNAGELFNRAADYNGFFHGFADGLLEVNRRTVKETIAKQNVDAGKYAIVIRNKETAIQAAVPKFFPKLIDARRTTRASSNVARDHGRKEGRKVRLSQVGGAAARQALS